jgi:hypothetical protein
MANQILTPEVTAVLEQVTITGNRVTLPQLDRATYLQVDKALQKAGGRWNTRARAHVFDGDPRAKLGQMLDTGVAIDEKKLFQAVYTPAPLAARMAALAQVRDQVVLEPSAGEGALVEACLAAGARAVDAIELNPETANRLAAKGHPVRTADFLQVQPMVYRRIVMNPPFTRGQDLAHLAHALRCLDRTEGRLVSILIGNTERPQLGETLAGWRHTLAALPAGTFRTAGTDVKTVLLVVEP